MTWTQWCADCERYHGIDPHECGSSGAELVLTQIGRDRQWMAEKETR